MLSLHSGANSIRLLLKLLCQIHLLHYGNDAECKLGHLKETEIYSPSLSLPHSLTLVLTLILLFIEMGNMPPAIKTMGCCTC